MSTIKNYTSQVTVNSSVQHIEDCLVKHGAKNILKTYNQNKSLSGIAFIVNVNDNDVPFKLPSRVERVEKKLMSLVKRPRSGTKQLTKAQAERTAWKLLSDWVDIQMSLIDLDQVELTEVFMPYIYDHSKQQTYFDIVKSGNYQLLQNMSNQGESK